jgi:Holliday junction resolvasome RuvABC endonuclease subunit
MKNKNNRILAIDPGARELGYAILDDYELIGYGIKSLKRMRPENILKKAVRDFINRTIIEYGIKIIVIEVGHFSQIESPLFKMVYNTILSTGNKQPLKVVEIAPETIRKCICGEIKSTKKNVAKLILEKYPELKKYLKQSLKWKEKYWHNVFDALATGLAFKIMAEKKRK